MLIGFAILLVAGTSTAAPSGFTFTRIGILPGEEASQVLAVNNAVTLAGCSSSHREENHQPPYTRRNAARWTRAEGLTALPLLPYTASAAIGATSSFVAGRDVTANGTQLLFTSHTTPQDGRAPATCSADGSNVVVLSTLPDGEKMHSANQISDNGSTIFGYASSGFADQHASRWTPAMGFELLVMPAGYTQSVPAARAVSADGSVSAGSMYAYDQDGYTTSADEAYRWTLGDGVTGIGYLQGDDRSEAYGLSSDSSTIFGRSWKSGEFPTPGRLFVWNTTSAMTDLGAPAENYDTDYVLYGAGISGDGSVAVASWHLQFFDGNCGSCEVKPDVSYVINTESKYYVEFKSAVRRLGASDAIEGWSQFIINGITDDGNTVFGFAQNPQLRNEGFIARFPAGFLRALAPPPPPQITSPSTATTTVGELFVYQITGSNEPTNYVAMNLPAGLSFNSFTGTLSGTLTTAGTRQITVKATNESGTGSQALSLTINATPSTPIRIISGTSIVARAGKPFSFQVRASGISSAATVAATGLPAGLKIDGATGVISGTTNLTGTFGVTVTVQEGDGIATETLEMILVNPAASAVITSPRSAILEPGRRFSYQITTDPSPVAYDSAYCDIAGHLPNGLQFDSSTRTISGTYKPLTTSRAASVQNALSTPDESVIGSIVIFARNSGGGSAATLTFLKRLPELLNISTRVRILSGEKVLIAGFIVTGDAPKKVLLRGIGPSLAVQGVNGALVDPVLDLQLPDGSVVTNDDWTTAQQAEVEATGISPTSALESALVQTLQAGTYTAVLSGKAGSPGVGLVEVYDLDEAADSKLANISTRGFVDVGDNVMIGGLIVGGGTTKVLVRALGPSLQAEGIYETLDDPQLELHDKNGATVASNDSWGDTQRTQIEATGIAPADDRECAILAALPAGNYTAIVRGANQTTGVSLVEVYDLNPNRR